MTVSAARVPLEIGARRSGSALVFVVVFLAYLAGARIAFWLIDATGLAAVMFPPAGVTVGALLLLGRRRWVAVLASAACAELMMDLWMDIDGSSTVGFLAANTLEPLVGALATMWLARARPDLTDRRHLWAFLGGAVGIGPLVGALVGAITVVGFGANGFLETLWQWWLGDALAVLVIGSLILTWDTRDTQLPAWSPPGLLLLAGSSAGVVAVLAWTDLPLLFLVLTAIVLAGAQFGVRTVAITAFCMAATAGVWLVFETGGLFTGLSPATGVVIVKLKFVVFTTTGLIVGAESAERVRASVAATDLRVQAVADHRVVERLQRLLLPPEEQQGPSYRATGLYVPAAVDFGVGGDWYEVAELPGGRTLVAIGDIVGSGPTAAAHTSRLRATVAVLAGDASDAAALLRAFEVQTVGLPGLFASTAWFGIYDRSSRELSYTSAGHPPAYAVTPEGVTRLELASNPPFGVAVGCEKDQAVHRVVPGSTIVAYTDGLIERRGESVDVGLLRLEQALASQPGRIEPSEIVRRIQAESMDGEGRDDTIVLAVEFP